MPSLKKIGAEAFVDCINLRKVNVGQSVDVDVSAFKGCYNL